MIMSGERLEFIGGQLVDHFLKLALSNLGILVLNKVIQKTKNEELKDRVV